MPEHTRVVHSSVVASLGAGRADAPTVRRRRWLLAIAALVLVAAWGPWPLLAQAEPLYVEFHVDVSSPTASDANLGSEASPLATITEAVRRADMNRLAGMATRIVVHPGTYRESVVTTIESRGGQPIVLEAREPGTAVVSGSDVWTDWTCEGRICTHHWPFAWGLAEVPWPQVEMEPVGRRREMVFVNGQFLDQQLTLFDVMMLPGSFHVDEREQLLTVHVPRNVDPAAAVFEVSVRDDLLRLQELHDLTIRGLVFQHGNPSVPGTAVRIVDQDNVIVENVVVRWNNWGGIWFKGRNIVMRDSVSTYNGANGMSAYQVEGLVLERNVSSYNNWRGFAGGLTGWAVGEKFLVTRDLHVIDHVAVHNLARGLWVDHDNSNVRIERLYACYNLNDGVFIERSQGPVTIVDSTLCSNGRAGLRTSATNDLEVRGNTLVGNQNAQLVISGDLDVTFQGWLDQATHVLKNHGWTITGNTLQGVGSEANLITTSLPREYWLDLMATATFDGNEYVHTRRDVFLVPGDGLVAFDDWRAEAVQDGTSSFRLE